MMMVIMSAASSGALMGLTLTTHASTPVLTTRLPTVQMAKVDRTFERWKRSMTRQGNKGGYGQSQQGMPQEGYGPMGDQQGVQQQGMPQQGYGPMTPRQRLQQQQAMRQQGMPGMQGMQGMQGMPGMPGMPGMRQQGMGQQGMRQQGMRQHGMRQLSLIHI